MGDKEGTCSASAKDIWTEVKMRIVLLLLLLCTEYSVLHSSITLSENIIAFVLGVLLIS